MTVLRAVLPGMRRQRSERVLNIASLMGLTGLRGTTAYSSSKFAVVELTE
jgi:short-subunit dehydrogenase